MGLRIYRRTGLKFVRGKKALKFLRYYFGSTYSGTRRLLSNRWLDRIALLIQRRELSNIRCLVGREIASPGSPVKVYGLQICDNHNYWFPVSPKLVIHPCDDGGVKEPLSASMQKLNKGWARTAEGAAAVAKKEIGKLVKIERRLSRKVCRRVARKTQCLVRAFRTRPTKNFVPQILRVIDTGGGASYATSIASYIKAVRILAEKERQIKDTYSPEAVAAN